jgi:hypothetical protein
MLAALLALPQIREVPYDKKAFGPLVRPHVKDEDGSVRRAAWYALANTAPEPGDVAAIAALVNEPAKDLRFAMPHLLSMFGNGDLESEVPSKAVLDLIDATPPDERRMFLSGIWGARYSRELETRLLELSREGGWEQRHDVFYLAVSTQGNKSAVVVERLIEVAGGEDMLEAERAQWGLAQGVVPAEQDRVVDFGLKLYEGRTGQARARALAIVRTYGTKKHAAAVRSLAGKPAITPDAQVELAALAAKLAEVPDREATAPKAPTAGR